MPPKKLKPEAPVSPAVTPPERGARILKKDELVIDQHGVEIDPPGPLIDVNIRLSGGAACPVCGTKWDGKHCLVDGWRGGA